MPANPTMGERYRCATCGKHFVKGEDCRVVHPDKACCHEYDAPANPTSVQEARLALDRRYEAALQGDCDIHDYCESRDALIAAVRAERDAEIRARVEGLMPFGPNLKGLLAKDEVLALLSDREGA